MEILTEIVPFFLGKKKADLKLTERGGNWLKRTSGHFSGFDQKCTRLCQLFSVSVTEITTTTTTKSEEEIG